MMDALLIFVCSVIGLAVVAAIYLLIRSKELMEAHNEPEAPYKVEPPKSTEQLAVSLVHKPIEWIFANAPEPKRKYTKRSKFWTDKRKKAAASKAKKKTHKSK